MKASQDCQRRQEKGLGFAPIEDAVEAIREGHMIIVVDDEDRENEGDLTIAAEKVTPDAINFMARYGRGLICISMTPERLDELEIPHDGQPEHRPLRDGILCLDRREVGPAPASRRTTGRRRFWRPSIPTRDRQIWPGRATCFRCARVRAACSFAQARPRPPSIWRGSPDSIQPASSAKS